MVRSPRISTVCLAVLYALSISNVYVAAVCTIPDGYKSYSWFQLYLDPPSPTAKWVYGMYDSDKIVTSRTDNASTTNLKYDCISSYEENGFFYYISSQAMFGESYCSKAKLTSDRNAIFVSEIQTNSADAKTCPAMFTESCFGAGGQVPICSAVWRPKSPPTVPPQFIPVQSPFQGSYQLTVNGTQCAGNPQSMVTVQGSSLQFKACPGTTTYKNRTIFQESLTVLGAMEGDVLTEGEKNSSTKVLLLVSADNVTLYCAKYTVQPDMSIKMTIDVSSESFGSCALPATVTSTDNKFVSLVMTSSSSSTMPSTGTSAAASGVTSQVTGQSARITNTMTTVAASAGSTGPRQTNNSPTGTAGTAGTRLPSSAGISGAGSTTGVGTGGMSTGAQTTRSVTTAATTAARTTAASTAAVTMANTATAAAAATTAAVAASRSSQGVGVSTTLSPASSYTSMTSMGVSSQATSGSAGSASTKPTTTLQISTTTKTTTRTIPSVCTNFTCPSPFQCNVNPKGEPECGCGPGMTLSNSTGQCSPAPGKDSGSKVWAIAVGVIGAFMVAAVVGFIVMCCMRSAWLARQGPLAYGHSHQHFHRHYPEQLAPTYFNDRSPTYEVNVQPITFPSRGSVYGGTLGLGFGGYTGQTKVCNHYPVMGNNSYVMVKSSIPPN